MDATQRLDGYLTSILTRLENIGFFLGEFEPDIGSERLIELIDQSGVGVPSINHFLSVQDAWLRDHNYFRQGPTSTETLYDWFNNFDKDHHLEYAGRYILGKPLVLDEESRDWVGSFLKRLAREFDMGSCYSPILKNKTAP